ncbi:hypothetical protein [Streptomyces cadmiisoli]|uniref:Uncharacterized protein n=1 Tax=Streptomyces cadmiisoli TaxID=2184053 RepID=A0A2Z4IS97_9ACTN|nr:hypothetical protein [Streptomyces cadmiisoli]AWW35705.1 hypothetical protein DN051_02735 [Streptomyces cadmiisoli]
MADVGALAGIALLMFLVGMSQSDRSLNPTQSQDVPGVLLALVWIIPAALALSCYSHARMRMPITSVVQGLFFVTGTALAIGQTNMLLSLS